MQSLVLKNIYISLLLIGFSCQIAYCQAGEYSMTKADSLFAQKKYTEALPIYESVFTQTGKFSPAMLLKMAFIQEGSGNYTKALYYLNLYYNQKPNEIVLKKMDELASKNQLNGYQYDDINFILIFYERYFLYIAVALIAFGTFVFSVIVIKKLRKEDIPVRHGFGFMVYLAGAFVFLNLSGNKSKAIVQRDNTYLMSAPSAGAKLVKVIQKGHRLEVLDKKDIWLEVKWEDKKAFVREQNAWLVN
ncbi:MAG: SH3 domain-containing protein [Bacteroidota bacterium]